MARALVIVALEKQRPHCARRGEEVLARMSLQAMSVKTEKVAAAAVRKTFSPAKFTFQSINFFIFQILDD
jgi:hypothetical protein